MKVITTFLSASSAVRLLVLGVAGGLAACSYTNGYQEPSPCNLPATVSYQQSVLPILQQSCFRCHDANHFKGAPPAGTNGTFNMEDFNQVHLYATTGVNGTPYMLGVVRHDGGFIPMPYDGGKLDACQIATIRAWIESGAPNN